MLTPTRTWLNGRAADGLLRLSARDLGDARLRLLRLKREETGFCEAAVIHASFLERFVRQARDRAGAFQRLRLIEEHAPAWYFIDPEAPDAPEAHQEVAYLEDRPVGGLGPAQNRPPVSNNPTSKAAHP